ncbi:MAG: hypothetical protein IT515_10215 [Burkholderiales bacterium]|nr:hypothetical protein [Burkholderiales bacterium]
MTIRQFLTVLKARKLVVLTVPLVACVAAAAASALVPARWTATASVLVDASAPEALTGNSPSAQAQAGAIATQVEIVRSRNVALKVVDKLRLNESAAAQREWREATEGRGSLKAWLADRLLGRLAVSPMHDSSVLAISFAGPDPQFAASAANAFAQSYVETNLELKLESARLAARWGNERARALGAAAPGPAGRLAAGERPQPAGAIPEPSTTDRERDGTGVEPRDAGAQRTPDVAPARYAQPNLESLATRTSVIVLSPAVEPVEPSFPNWPLNVAVALGIGALLGVGAALVMESLDQRVRSAGDVSETLEVPLLATLPHARSPRRVQTRLVGERPARAEGAH